MHVEDLIATERSLGYSYEIPGSEVEHYQWICPPCRRALFALAQGQLWQGVRGGVALDGAGRSPHSEPDYVNPALRQGPLGEEDARNFHP
jgi:hypothetical protein